MSGKAGAKFTEKYGVSSATFYKGDTEALKIPGPTHALFDSSAPTTFDELRVAVIDADGHMTDPIEVWTDPDTSTLWVLDGRGRALDVREVNRRRKKDGRELVQPYIVPFNGNEKRAIARMFEKNFHRRAPSPSAMANGLLKLRNAGYSWEDCAASLHVKTDDAQQWGRRLMPIAFCAPEVQAAIDAGEVSKGVARKFGGGKLDGSKALKKADQLALLKTMTDRKKAKKGGGEKNQRGNLSYKARQRVRDAFVSSGAFEAKGTNQMVARIVDAAFARVGGDLKALDSWPEIAAVVNAALEAKPVGRPKKSGNGHAAKANTDLLQASS